jgi:hypothetical protein
MRVNLFDFFRDANAVHAKGGPTIIRQFLESAMLRIPPGRLGLSEYFDYRLFEPNLSWPEKRRFVGWRGEPYLDRCNSESSHVYADDKLRLASILSDANLHHPPLVATYRNKTPVGTKVAQLKESSEFVEWLRNAAVFPLFAKPVHAGFGRGAFLLQEIDNEEYLVLGHGSRVRLDDWVEGLTNPEDMGYMLQELQLPHPALTKLLSDRLSSLRVMVLREPGKSPCIYRAVWKIPRQFNIIDNYESGTLGNMLGEVNLDNGKVLNVIQGHGLSMKHLTHHPDSGLSFEKLTLPDWDRLLEICLKASNLLPDFRFQHWDVALTALGPVLLEINLFAAGGTELSQLADKRGLLEPRLLKLNRL